MDLNEKVLKRMHGDGSCAKQRAYHIVGENPTEKGKANHS